MAGLVAKYLEIKNIEKSIVFANQCATVAVQKRGIFSDISSDKSIKMNQKTVGDILDNLYDHD